MQRKSLEIKVKDKYEIKISRQTIENYVYKILNIQIFE